MPIRLNGSTSGYSQLDAPAIAGDQLFTLPGAGGTLDRINRAGNVLQVVNTWEYLFASGTATIPADNTKPQSNEGTEFMSLSITPTSSTSKLLINVCANVSHSLAGTAIVVALFRDSGADALATSWISQGTAGEALPVSFDHYLTAGTTSATTFKVRAGALSAGTLSFNGVGGVGYFNATYASTMTITEIAS